MIIQFECFEIENDIFLSIFYINDNRFVDEICFERIII